jgi:chromosome segregation ATPase
MPPKNAPQEHDRNAEITTIASPYATNPASLLWAQQLKRENGHLLARMDSLETEHRTYNARFKSAETAADIARATDQKVKELSSRVDAIRDDENKQKDLYGRIIGDNHAKMEKASETWRKTQQKVSTLDTQYRSMQADMQQTSSSHDSTSRSIEAIQVALRRLEGTANSSDDGALIRRLDTIESYRSKEAEEARRMRDKVTSLERTCQTIIARNSELQAEVNHLKATIETKAHVHSNTEGFSRTNARTQTPASPGSNER